VSRLQKIMLNNLAIIMKSFIRKFCRLTELLGLIVDFFQIYLNINHKVNIIGRTL